MLADKIIELRRGRGWSQEELAEQLGVTRQSVSKWEGDQSTPDVEKIVLMSQLFGVSTDCLLKEETATTGEGAPAVRRVTAAEAMAALNMAARNSVPMAVATLLCILSPVTLLVLIGVAEMGWMAEQMAVLIGLVVLFLMVVPAVMLFVACGARNQGYEYMEKDLLALDPGVDEVVRQWQDSRRRGYVRGNVLGVGCCVVSPVSTLMGAFSQHPLWLMVGVAITIALAGAGVMHFVLVGVLWGAPQRLLQEGEYTPLKKQSGRLLDRIAPIYWMAVTAGYLAWSFAADAWEISWMVWPVAGVLFALLAAVCEVVTKHKQ